MKKLGAFGVRRRWAVLASWVVVLAALIGAMAVWGADFTTSTSLPDSESSRAYALLAQANGGTSSSGSGRIVWHTTDESITDPGVQSRVAAMLADVAALPGVTSVVSPYEAAGTRQINPQASTAYANVTVDGSQKLATIVTTAHEIAGDDVEVAVGGGSFTSQPSPSHGMEAVGLLAALVLLVLMFRSVGAAVLPLVTGVVGVGTSLLVVMLASHAVSIASESITMGALIGLGVGIDYALFVVNRHRKALMSGRTVEQAAGEALTTSGRAVLFAGATVVAALLCMSVIGLGVLTSMAQAAAVTVVCTVAAALTLLPALLGILGARVLSRKQRAVLAGEAAEATGHVSLAARWSTTLQRHAVLLGLGGLLVVALVAVPATTMRVGDADDSSAPVGSNARTYYNLTSTAYGAGFDARLLLVATTPDNASSSAFTDLEKVVSQRSDVAAVVAYPTTDSGIRAAVVVPTTSAQSQTTADLVASLRSDTIPAAVRGTSLQVDVGGATASSIDLSSALMSKLPLYLGIIALLGFVLLTIAFRSVVVAAVGAVSTLVTLCAGLGAVTAIFQHGWGIQLFNVGSAAPIMYFVPVLIVGVVFGLSMDYQVFLMSRVHEEWTRTGDSTRAVRVGVAETGRVIATAATIMLAVFASFSFTGERIVSAMGIGLALAVLLDAFVMRLTIVPALMHGLRRATWYMPRWLDRVTPHLSVEGEEPAEESLDELEMDPVGAGR